MIFPRNAKSINVNGLVTGFSLRYVLLFYLNQSYWNEKPAVAWPGATLWAIRDKFGKDFADKLSAFMLKHAADVPSDVNGNGNVDQDFYRRLKMADQALEDSARWPDIDAILKAYGSKQQ
jgi:hypothetical protein